MLSQLQPVAPPAHMGWPPDFHRLTPVATENTAALRRRLWTFWNPPSEPRSGGSLLATGVSRWEIIDLELAAERRQFQFTAAMWQS